MTTTAATAAPAKKAPARKTTTTKPAAAKPAPKTPAKKVAQSNEPAPKPVAVDLARLLTAARAAGFTCRALAKLANPDVPLEPGTDTWKLAGRVDRLSRGGAATPDELRLLLPVLDGIESGAITPPERTTATRKPSKRAEVIHVLETAAQQTTVTNARQLIAEALRLLGADTK
ncbi:hypothetical protein [Kribbella sp.]|uniref:hypothetical protein n=1 Tax=Kribbella sp. TaxID=1871183 RepID=UPI002D3494D0|nr:hypothetical protein [Kribbella sp.]HZX07208.1 hypothetical protein [Kribbella sp.]